MVIVLVTMLGFGVLAFRLIQESEDGKGDARVAALAQTGVSAYAARSREALTPARAATGDLELQAALRAGDLSAVAARLEVLRTKLGVDRVEVRVGARVIAGAGPGDAIAAARQPLDLGDRTVEVRVATISARQLARTLTGGIGDAAEGGVVVRRGDEVLAATLPGAARLELPRRGVVDVAGEEYRVAGFRVEDGERALVVSVLGRDTGSAASSVGDRRIVAIAFLTGFFLVAFVLALAVSRGLQQQMARFLAAARRLRSGDFSQPVPIQGKDEFAQLGQEFNTMAAELERRLAELAQERARLQDSIRRIGQSFVANLDRDALVAIGVQTAVDAVEADGGRASLRAADGALAEASRAGRLDGLREAIEQAEERCLAARSLETASIGDLHALAAPLGATDAGRPAMGVVSVGRAARPFSPSEREVFQSLAGQAAVSVENVTLHEQVRRQAVTDELTGLSNHRRFQGALEAELERARRFGQEVGLLMLDIDFFKRVNDTYGHPQGDAVLREVARVLIGVSREIDEPARYGGEELAIVLPQTDIEGVWQAAERVRTAIEGLRIARLDGEGHLRVTASLGVAATTHGSKAQLIDAADRALYEAKHSGRNQTVRGQVRSEDAGAAAPAG